MHSATPFANTATHFQAEGPVYGIVADAPITLAPLGGGASATSWFGGTEGQGAKAGMAADKDDNAADPALDRKLTTAQLALGAGAVAAPFVRVGGTRQLSEFTLSARAATGRGTPGAPSAGRGEGGGDTVIGSTGATAGAFAHSIIPAATNP